MKRTCGTCKFGDLMMFSPIAICKCEDSENYNGDMKPRLDICEKWEEAK